MNLQSIKFIIRNPHRWYFVLSSKGLLNWLPDKAYLKLAYRLNMKKRLDLDNPQSFNEKINYLKIYDRNDLYTQLADKYRVREFIAETIGEEYLIPLVGGPWRSFEEIDFDTLPEQFVFKCNHDSGGLSICRDKKQFDFEKAKTRISKSLKKNFYWLGREYQYKNIEPLIIAEKYMDDYVPGDDRYGHGLTDYKFFVFNGEVKFLYVSRGLEHHPTASISFYDLNGDRLPFKRKDYKAMKEDHLSIPLLDEMISLSTILAKKIPAPFMRVDLYLIQGKIYFSEFTLCPCDGLVPFDPPEADLEVGNMLDISCLADNR